MLQVDKDGMINSPRVLPRRFTFIEHGDLERIRAIVIHQTDSDTTESTFSAYRYRR